MAISTISKTIRDSDTAGASTDPARPHEPFPGAGGRSSAGVGAGAARPQPGTADAPIDISESGSAATRPTIWDRFSAYMARATIVKLLILLLVFSSVPAILYVEFNEAYSANQKLLQLNVREQGRLIARAMQSFVASPDNPAALPEPQKLGKYLTALAGNELHLRILLRPENAEDEEAFFFVAAAPTASDAELAKERSELSRLGVISRLAPTCEGGAETAVPYDRPDGAVYIVTSIVPFTTSAGCWVVVMSRHSDDARDRLLGKPFWTAPELQTAGVIYALMAALVMLMFWGIWRSMRKFGELARDIRAQGRAAPSFRQQNRVPELSEVAEEFDRMVSSLQSSSVAIKRAAEDNAHAYKTPIAIIRQCLEPLHRFINPDDKRPQRALSMINTSLDRLDDLVASARQMDETSADLIDPPKYLVDISYLTKSLSDGYVTVGHSRQITVRQQIDSQLAVLASDDMLETVLENLLENALSFTPDGGMISVILRRDTSRPGQYVALAVSDSGPGVTPDDLPRIFDRYYSKREAGQPHRQGQADAASAQTPPHMGIGLWVVRRNIEAFGGHVLADNAPEGGFRITVLLPEAPPRRMSLRRPGTGRNRP